VAPRVDCSRPDDAGRVRTSQRTVAASQKIFSRPSLASASTTLTACSRRCSNA
jgi:hypothetical protein